MARQRYLLVRVIGTRHGPHGAIGRRQRLCLGQSIQKCLGWRKFALPVFIMTLPVHGKDRMRRGKQGDDGEHPHKLSMNLRSLNSKSKVARP